MSVLEVPQMALRKYPPTGRVVVRDHVLPLYLRTKPSSPMAYAVSGVTPHRPTIASLVGFACSAQIMPSKWRTGLPAPGPWRLVTNTSEADVPQTAVSWAPLASPVVSTVQP